MSSAQLEKLVELFTPYEATQLLLAETGLQDISHTLFAGTTGLAVQALVTGSVLQLVHRYFRRQARLAARAVHGSDDGGRDPTLARAGVIWLTALICLHVIVVYVANARILLMSQHFTAGYLMDFFLAQISSLIFTVVTLPVFLFFAFRAWNLWSRRKAVMVLCLAAVTPAVILGLVSAGYGLQHPYPLEDIDNVAFAAWLPFVEMTIKKQQWVALASSFAQFVAACVFSGLICTGLFAHRNCCALMPGFSSKVAFISGESLAPLVLTSAGILAGDLLTKLTGNSVGALISRAVHSCAPAIYFHCLMNSLTSAQRQRDSLRVSISHHHGGPGFGHGEKGEFEEEDEDNTFNPHYHRGDLDTPLRVEYDPTAKGTKSFLPFSLFEINTASDGYITSAKNRIGTAVRSVMARGPTKQAEEPEDHYTVRSAGQGRRSSLARACSYTSNKASDLGRMTGLSIKMQNKGIPTLSYKPPLGRRESESIFVAHEEFEGLPDAPGDGRLRPSSSLGDIEEGGSNAATPKFFTPPRMPSPSFGHGAEWKDDNYASGSGTHSREVDFARSPESVYEPQLTA